MAIGTPNPENISTGWQPPTMFHAPEIGSLVAGILHNRLGQQELQQKQIADAIKEYQSQRSAQAFIKGAQNYNLLPQGDLSGLSAHDAAVLAQQIQDQYPTSQEKYYDALTKILNDTGQRPGIAGSGRGGRGGSMVTVTDENGEPILGADGNPVQVPAGSRLGQQVIADQGNITTPPSASVAANIAAKMNLPPQSITDTGSHQGMGYVPGGDPGWAKGQTGPVDQQGNPTNYLPVSPGDEPTDIKVSPRGVDPKTGQPYQPVIVQKDTLEQLRRALQGRSYRPQRGPQPGTVNDQTPLPQKDVDQANQAPGVTPTPIPYDQTIPTPTPGGADKNLATGYGTSGTNMSADDIRNAFRAGKITEQEARTRLKAIGFSD